LAGEIELTPVTATFEVLAGAALGAVAIFPFRKRGSRFLTFFFASTLVIAAFIYFAFAAGGVFKGTADYGSLGFEAFGLLIFSIVSFAGWKLSPALLAVGWLGHTYWDAGLHGYLATPYVPELYPGICIGFDLVFGAFIAYYFYFRDRA
jgi:hypothetical protein